RRPGIVIRLGGGAWPLGAGPGWELMVFSWEETDRNRREALLEEDPGPRALERRLGRGLGGRREARRGLELARLLAALPGARVGARPARDLGEGRVRLERADPAGDVGLATAREEPDAHAGPQVARDRPRAPARELHEGLVEARLVETVLAGAARPSA